MWRTLGVFILATGLLSCTETVPLNRRLEASSSDPAITGHSELISRAEIHAALSVARERLAVLAPSSPIFRVVVITPSRFEAYYCSSYQDRSVLGLLDNFFQNHPVRGFLTLQRTDGGWRVLPGHDQRTLNDSGIIVTWRRSETVWPNQTMKRVATGVKTSFSRPKLSIPSSASLSTAIRLSCSR
jgi:hypothetical protein